ncbi:FG-GAP repeat domain protein [Synechococcus sp. PCC 7335]|uniref:beta strand repeat-containing protein n=1 Tax=Synechococcus sp. (strain ATCC 29403 / PCC 7335) TaxID=91464 RepID=UPI00017ECF06|nr:Ig-like domain-containing protein [Synechococcus sp. PCC 7335]EDX82844.1 FG-GAP repeat domain protein [Synechococcus sp. PCC 7335]
MSFDAVFNLADLDGTNGFVINGIALGYSSGNTVSSGGDVNGDGFDDLIIGVPDVGASFVVFGAEDSFAPSLELSALDGSNGFVINGIGGSSVSSGGDVNGDGVDDLIIGAPGATSNGKRRVGESYVVFGSEGGFAPSLELSALDGSNGFVLNGIDDGDSSGSSVSSAGDVNGDGFDDLIIGAPGADPNGNNRAGESYVVFGSEGGFAPSLELSALDGSNGFVLNGIGAFNSSGRSVSSAGDVNGDGLDDLIIGASSGNTYVGESYVVFGSEEGFAPSLELSALDGSNGFVLNGIDDGDASGRSVSSAGDVNGDGIDDLVIGAPNADPNEIRSAGESYVVFGFEGGFAPSLELSALDGSNGFVIEGIDRDDRSGSSVSSAGDVNGDGFDDLTIGAGYAGESYVVFGAEGGFAPRLELSALDDSNGFVISGIYASDRFDYSVSDAGDVNGDGFDDLIIGVSYSDPYGIYNASASYVIFGQLARPAPSAADDIVTTDEDSPISGNVLDNDSDVDSNSLMVTAVNGAAANVGGEITLFSGALLTLNADGSFVYDPNGQFEALSDGETDSDRFIYTFSDGTVTGRATVTVTIDGNIGFNAALNLADLDGSNGFVINGIDDFDLSGRSVSSAGDVNGDGFDDLIIGAPNADPDGKLDAGESYVVFGAADGFTPSLELSALDGNNGFVINGIDAYDISSYSVSSAGDVNGDGFDDLIIGARFADPNGNTNAGESYVVFGAADGFTPSLELSALDGNNGFVINGIDAYDISGRSVSSAGDVNGDGFDDLIIGALLADPNGRLDAGESYVVFGAASGFAPSLELSALDGSNGFVINGIDDGDYSGRSVSSVGDVNGDGFDDLIIGAPDADPNGRFFAGESYVVFGAGDGFAPSLELSALDGSNGFVIDGIDDGDYSDRSISSAGDVNGDGFDDLIIGADYADPNGNISAGESYVVFGAASGFAPSLELSALDGSNGFVINGIDDGDYSDRSVSSAGDVNGDGFDDLIIGAPDADPNGRFFAGESYVVFGAGDGFASSLELSTLDGSNGFTINGIDRSDASGRSVSSVGDVNGDGFDDLIIGAPNADPNGNTAAGESYVIFGQASKTDGSPANTRFGTSGNDALIGDVLANSIDALGGDDTVAGKAGNDILFGGDGDDILRGDANSRKPQDNEGGGDDIIFGGNGSDRIGGKAGNDILIGDAGNDFIWGDDGDDILFGGTGNDTLVGDNFSDGSGSDLFVFGAGDGTDTLLDFEVDIDRIGLVEGELTFAELAISQDSGSTVLGVVSTSETIAILNGVQASSLSESSFAVVTDVSNLEEAMAFI